MSQPATSPSAAARATASIPANPPQATLHSRRPSDSTSVDTLHPHTGPSENACWRGFVNFFRVIWEGFLDLLRKIFGCPKKDEPTDTAAASGAVPAVGGEAPPAAATAPLSHVPHASGAVSGQETRDPSDATPEKSNTPHAPRASSSSAAAASVASRAHSDSAAAAPAAPSAKFTIAPAPRYRPLGPIVPITISPAATPTGSAHNSRTGTPRGADQPASGRLTPRAAPPGSPGSRKEPEKTASAPAKSVTPKAGAAAGLAPSSAAGQRLEVRERFKSVPLNADGRPAIEGLLAIIKETPDAIMRFVRYDEVLNLLWAHLEATLPPVSNSGADIYARRKDYIRKYLLLHFVLLTPAKLDLDLTQREALSKQLKHPNFTYYAYGKASQLIDRSAAARGMGYTYPASWRNYVEGWKNSQLEGFM